MYKKLKSIKFWINKFFLISLIATSILFVMCLGGGGVLEDYENTLKEMKFLEKGDSQTISSYSVSDITQREMKFFKNSSEFQEHIVKENQFLSELTNIFYFFRFTLVMTIFAKLFLYFRSKSFINKKLS